MSSEPTVATANALRAPRTRRSIVLAIRSAYEFLASYLFGVDVFICYARLDAFGYAAQLAESLANRKLSVFIDQRGAPAGRTVPRSVLRSCRLARMLVVVGSDAARQSVAMDAELESFPRMRRPLVAIDVDGAIGGAIWADRVPGVAATHESVQALRDGRPSDAVIQRVLGAARFTRRETVQTRAVVFTAVLTSLLLLATAVLGFRIRSAAVQLREIELRAADTERGTRIQLGRTASLLASRTGREHEAAEAGLAAVAPGRWFSDAPPAEAVAGLAEAAGAIWYSLPLEGRAAGIESAAFTPDGTLLVAQGSGGKIAWSTVSGRRVADLAAVPDVSALGTLQRSDEDIAHYVLDRATTPATLKNRATGATIAPLSELAGNAAHYAFSRDESGYFLATGTNDSTLQVWTAHDGRLYATLAGHSKQTFFEHYVPLDQRPGPGELAGKRGGKVVRHSGIGITWVAFSPHDPNLLISAARDRSAIIWNLRWKGSQAVLGGHDFGVNYADFSPSGKYAVSASEDGAVRLWLTDGRPMSELRYHDAPVRLVVFTADETRLATFSSDDVARIWRPLHDDSVRTLDDRSSQLDKVGYAPDGKHVVASSQVDGHARVWEVGTGKLIAKLIVPAPRTDDLAKRIEAASAPSPSPIDPREPLASSESFRFGEPVRDRIGNAAQRGNPKWAFDPGPVFSSRAPRLLTQSGKFVVCWDTRTWKEISRFTLHAELLSAAAMSSDGLRVVSSDNDRNTFLWDANTGKSIAAVPIPDTVTAIAFSPAGDSFATASHGSGAAIWDASTGQLMRSLHPEVASVTSIAYNGDGKEVLTAGQDYAWRLSDAATGAARLTAVGRSEMAVFSPDYRTVLTTHATDATLWNATTGAVIAELEGHVRQISAARFSADGERVVTASWDETVRLWNARNGAPIATLRGHVGPVADVRLSPDDRFVATASFDGTVKIFPAHVDELVARVRAAIGRVESHPQ